MQGYIRFAVLVLVASVLVSFSTPVQPVAAQLATAEFKCQNTTAKQGRKLFRKTFKALAKCEDKISKGDLPDTTDCAMEIATAAKIADADANYSLKLTQFCTDPIVSNLTFGGSCNGVTTVAALTTCATAEHKASAQELITLVYPRDVCASGFYVGRACVTNADCPSGSNLNPGTCEPANQGLDTDQRRCQKLLGKTVSKEAAKRMGTIQKCKKKISKGKLPASTDCVTTSQVKLGDLLTTSREKIALACPSGLGAPLAVAGTCAGATATTSVQSCSLCLGDRKADDLIAVQYGSSAFGVQAVAKQITDTADCVGGPLSRCRVNDYILRNDKIRVVIQDLQRNMFGIGQFGGQIIDADLVRSSGPDRDNFEEWSLSLNIEGTAHYTSLTVINDGSDGGAAIIRATGVDDLLDFLNPSAVLAGFNLNFPPQADDVDLPLFLTTDYILEPGKSYVRVETTVENIGGSQVDMYFGEFLNGSGQVEVFQPGYGFGEPLVTGVCSLPTSPTPPDTPCTRNETLRNFVIYGGHDEAAGVSYGYLHEGMPKSTTFSTSGVTVPQLGVEIILALLNLAQRPLMIPAGESVMLTRYFAVGDTISSVTDINAEIQCKPTGRVSGVVTAGGNPAADADVTILGALDAAPSGFNFNAITTTRTDASGNYSLTLPPGDYTVVANLDGYPYQGGGSLPVENPITVVATQTVTQNIALPATGGLQVTVTDQDNADSPAKVSVVGFDPSPEPVNVQNIGFTINRTGIFGDFEDSRPYGVASVKFLDPSGDSGVFPIEPGDYRVVVSRGMEYSIDTEDVTIQASPVPAEVVAAKVEHVLDTDGFISADFHVHSIDSPDSETKWTDRVRSLIGEGLDFFTPSDHDIRVDFAPTINAMGASGLLGTVTSGEITTFDYGHFNAWPMTIDPLQVNGGSVDHGGAAPAGQDFPSLSNYSLSPADIIAAAHADPGTDTVQVNHVHSHLGLDGGSGMAIDTGVSPPQSTVPPLAHRLDPGVGNYFTNLPAAPAAEKFDALEIWIGDDRGQIYNNFLGSDTNPTAKGGNIGDWFNLINQGIISTGIADSDTHNTLVGTSGNPRNLVASPSDDPADLAGLAETLSANVNAGLSIGTNGPMVRVEISAASTGDDGNLEHGGNTLIATTNGEVVIDVDIQSPEWAEFDRVEYYVNTTTTRRSVPNVKTGAGTITLYRYRVTPDYIQDVTPTLEPVAGTSSNRWEASTSLSLTGLTEDTWVVVMVKGRDNVSKPMFPVIPTSMLAQACSNNPCRACTTDADCGMGNTCSVSNQTLAELVDGNLNQCGITALAFTNPLFVDVDGGGWDAPGLSVIP